MLFGEWRMHVALLQFSGWSLFAGCLSLVLAHRHVICLDQEWLHVRFKRLVARVEHAHPVHSAIHRMRHHLIQGSEVVAASVLAEERAKRLLTDADVQAKDRRTVEIGELIIEVARHKRHKRKPMVRRNVPIRIVEEEAVARIGHNIHALTCLSDVPADLSFVHR